MNYEIILGHITHTDTGMIISAFVLGIVIGFAIAFSGKRVYNLWRIK